MKTPGIEKIMLTKNAIKAIVVSVALATLPITVANTQPSYSEFTYESSATNYRINVRSWVASISFLPDAWDGRCSTVTLGSIKNASKYTLQLSLSSNMANPIERKFTTPVGGGISHKFTGLQGNTTYYYRALGEDSYRPEWTNVKSFTTKAALANGAILSCM